MTNSRNIVFQEKIFREYSLFCFAEFCMQNLRLEFDFQNDDGCRFQIELSLEKKMRWLPQNKSQELVPDPEQLLVLTA